VSLISKLGPLELSFISALGALFLYRIQAAPESRVAAALVFIFSARFGTSFISGFSISDATASSFGALDTVLAYIFLSFAFLEYLLLKRHIKWRSSDLLVLIALLLFGFLNLTWKVTSNFGLSASDFLFVLVTLLFLAVRPTRIDLRFLPFFGAAIICLVSITALVKYQNPLFPYRGVDYGLGSPYQNRVWEFFGWEERFRGPYQHPNQLGIHITFLSSLVLLRPSKFYVAILPFSFTLLFLSSSRTSILALVVGLLFRIYFDATSRAKTNQMRLKQNSVKIQPSWQSSFRKKLFGLLALLVFIAVIRTIVGNNTTGTGRLQNNLYAISLIRENWLIGLGPSLFSINGTENTILTILTQYGLLGLVFLLVVVFAFTSQFKGMSTNLRYSFIIALSIFVIATSGEALLTGNSLDTGPFYFFVLLVLTREGNSGKAPSQT